MRELCGLFGVSKQAYYKYDEDALMRRAAQTDFALRYIREVREQDPGIGGVKLWYMYQRDFVGNNSMGRDRFLSLLDEYGMKLRRKLRKVRTTDSGHGLRTYPNLVRDFIPTAPNQLWVSDITYIATWPGHGPYRFCYLSMVLDAYTEEIVGYSVQDTLETKGPMEALQMALERTAGKRPDGLIHHSDRGCQYASHEYVNVLQSNGIRISMTESGDPKENAQAERINNTMKNELLKDRMFADTEQVRRAVASAVEFYNTRRPHMSIGMLTPALAAEHTGELPKLWKSFRTKAIKKAASENPEKSILLQPCQGAPFGLRPPVNP